MAKSARARSTCAAGALSERLRRVSSWRSSAVSGRRGSFRWRDIGHLGARGSPHHYTSSYGKRPTSGGSVLHGIKCSDSRVLGVRAVEFIMTAPLSQDLRGRIVRAVEGGSTMRQAARRFAVSASAAIKLMQRVRQTGSLAPAKIGGYRRPLLEKHADELRAIVSSQAGITLKEMRHALPARGIVVTALSTIADMLHRLGLSHKKKSLRASEQDRPDVARHRSRWRVWQRY